MADEKTSIQDRSDFEDAEDLQEAKEQLEQEMLEAVLQTYEGRHVVFNILNMGNLFYEHGWASYDFAEMNRQEGRREMAARLYGEILTVDPSAYNLMRKECLEFNAKFEAPEIREDEDTGSED